MQKFDLYSDIATRTDGDIYIGVVGPVRTGKSTFIKRFMEAMVIPGIESKPQRKRTIDELPQSADGKTIMTTEPKFVPNEAIKIKFSENIVANVRMIDCVGYLVSGALGHREGDKPRYVRTPWSDQEIPFEKAGEIGTEKVIKEHSTIGIVVTTDGSITELARANYVEAEERVIKELKSLNKPFAVILNTVDVNNPDTIKLKEALSIKYGVAVIVKNILELNKADAEEILSEILMEFPVKLVEATIPKWMQALDSTSLIIQGILKELQEVASKVSIMRDYAAIKDSFADNDYIQQPNDIILDMGRGKVVVELNSSPELFYRVVSEESNRAISDDFTLLSYIKSLKNAEIQYSQFKSALEEVATTGYGIVTPTNTEMTLEEPELVKQGSRYGVKLKASAPSLHIMRVDVAAEVNPIVGTEQQGEELVKYLMAEFDNNKNGIWNTNMFGKSLSSLVNESLNNKINSVPADILGKMRKTMSRIVNEGKGGVICILL